MYEVHVNNRGPEGVRGQAKVRLSQKGSDDLQQRIEAGTIDADKLLAGLETPEQEAERLKEEAKSNGKKPASADGEQAAAATK